MSSGNVALEVTKVAKVGLDRDTDAEDESFVQMSEKSEEGDNFLCSLLKPGI